MTHPVKAPKKLIEVALPLDAINAAAAREKSIRHGHPSTLHLWWARRPLAAARAVIFGQLVNDPSWEWDMEYGSELPPPADLEGSWAESRKHLFRIIEELVQWENTTNETVLEKARAEIRKSWRETCELNKDHPQAAELFNPDRLPSFHDPFAGGGSIPLEAQRLGLEAYASDLNPVAVLINKAMIEIPPKFAGRPPINPEYQRLSPEEKAMHEWRGAHGLAEDVRYYGQWMRNEAQKRIGHLYPPVEVTAAMAKGRPDLKSLVGQKLTVIAWLWARTVKSPSPAFRHVDVPMASTFILSSKEGNEAYVQPIVEGNSYRFTVKIGKPPAAAKNGTKLARGANFRCLLSGSPIEGDYVKSEGCAGRMGARLLAIVCEGPRGRVYASPTSEHEALFRKGRPEWKVETALPDDPRNFWTVQYGLKSYGDLFTPRQLVALTTFSDLVTEAQRQIGRDGLECRMPNDEKGLSDGGTGAAAYAEAISVYLGLGSSRAADAWSTLVTWRNQVEPSRNTFARQALPMTWDFTEINPFSSSCGNWIGNSIEWVEKSLQSLPCRAIDALTSQQDAQRQSLSLNKFVSTDPPYYDNISYADLSDFFYIWLRRSLKPVFADLFATVAVPKAEELIASRYRHGTKEKAEEFFLSGMFHAMQRLANQAHPSTPITVYYAFKQSESETESGTTSTG
jgi:putative DNA methylase